MKWEVVLEDKQFPQFGVLTCITEADDVYEAIRQAEERYPFYSAFYATMLLGRLTNEKEQY